MASYRTIADSEVEANAPLTEALVTALRDNVTAITEGAAGAPRVVSGALSPTTAVDDGSTTMTLSGLGSYGGALIFAHFTAGGGGSPDPFAIAFSDDGTTFYGTTTIQGLATSDRGTAQISVDFASRQLRAVTSIGNGTPDSVSGLVTGLTVACTHIKLTAGGNIAAMILPLGAVA